MHGVDPQKALARVLQLRLVVRVRPLGISQIGPDLLQVSNEWRLRSTQDVQCGDAVCWLVPIEAWTVEVVEHFAESELKAVQFALIILHLLLQPLCRQFLSGLPLLDVRGALAVVGGAEVRAVGLCARLSTPREAAGR